MFPADKLQFPLLLVPDRRLSQHPPTLTSLLHSARSCVNLCAPARPPLLSQSLRGPSLPSASALNVAYACPGTTPPLNVAPVTPLLTELFISLSLQAQRPPIAPSALGGPSRRQLLVRREPSLIVYVSTQRLPPFPPLLPSRPSIVGVQDRGRKFAMPSLRPVTASKVVENEILIKTMAENMAANGLFVAALAGR